MARVASTRATGLTPQSFMNMLEDAGAAFVDLELMGGEDAKTVAEKMKEAKAAGNALGATTGGFEIDFSYEVEGVETDGKKFEWVGSQRINLINAMVATTLQEFTGANIERALPTAVFDETKQRFSMRGHFEQEDYIPNLWVIINRKGGGYFGILLENAINVEGASITTNNNGEAELPVNFQATKADITDDEGVPAYIYLFYPPEDAEGTEGASATMAAATTSFEDMTNPQLKDFAAENDIDLGGATTKQDIIDKITN